MKEGARDLVRDLWRRHKRKLFVTLGVVDDGYAFYKVYNAYKQRLGELEKELVSEKEHEELIKAQMQEHFMTIQRIADSTTLPHTMNYLSCRVAQDLDLSLLTERLQQGKGQPNSLTSSEKLELWNMLKILSFTRVVLSLWSTTILSLYVRVQVNILGRHLYIDTARGLESSHLLISSSFDWLLVPAQMVLLAGFSAEFRIVVDVSLKAVVDALVKDMADQAGGGNALSGIPLVKLLPRITQMGTVLLSEPTENRFIQIVTNVQDVELFFTLLYANSPPL
ncbi:hypothetical protein Droror1_Dr00027412 [Drosera rotundifolia]